LRAPTARRDYSVCASSTPADRGFSFEATWEPRFLPTDPSLATDQEATTARALGAFLFWRQRF
jgi:hypothetical protein